MTSAGENTLRTSIKHRKISDRYQVNIFKFPFDFHVSLLSSNKSHMATIAIAKHKYLIRARSFENSISFMIHFRILFLYDRFEISIFSRSIWEFCFFMIDLRFLFFHDPFENSVSLWSIWKIIVLESTTPTLYSKRELINHMLYVLRILSKDFLFGFTFVFNEMAILFFFDNTGLLCFVKRSAILKTQNRNLTHVHQTPNQPC